MKIRGPDATVVTGDGAFNFDYVCAIVAQQHAAKGARHRDTDFYNLDTL